MREGRSNGVFSASLVALVAACSTGSQSRQSSVSDKPFSGSVATVPAGSGNAVAATPATDPNATGTGTSGTGPAGTGTSGTGTPGTGTPGTGTTGPGTTGNGTSGTGTNGTGSNSTSTGGSSGSIGTMPASQTSTVTPPPSSKTLEQCQAVNQAWRAVVNGGQAPNDCVDTLVSWCCTRSEVENRFPTMAAALEQHFQTYIDAGNETLYACSVSASNAYSFSLAKIVGGTTTYDVITVSNVTPSVPASPQPASSCPPATTASLVKSN